MEINGIKMPTIKNVTLNLLQGRNDYGHFGISCPNLAPLKQDTVSFKGNVLKKSDFQGVDLTVIERYKPNIQQFKSKDDLQTFAEGEINKLKEKDFGGRQEETRIQRKAMLEEWFDYVIKENDAYSNTQRLIILSAVTKDLKPNNDTIPPVLNKGVLAQTITELEEKLKTNPKENFDFHKMYKNNLRTSLMKDSSTGETMTGWVVIPSKINDPENFEKNVEKLKTLSHKNWCTKSFNAEPYLSEGDFHIYLENGQPKLGVRFIDDEIEEIQGEKNDGKIPLKYFGTFEKYLDEQNLKLGWEAKDEFLLAKQTLHDIEIIKENLGDSKKLKNIEDAEHIFKLMDIKTQRTKDKKLIIANYNTKDYNPASLLGLDEQKLFDFVEEVRGNAYFGNTNIIKLNNLKSIGGTASFENSLITDLGKLKYIGDYAYFGHSSITDLGELKEIVRYADFSDSKIENLGKLEFLGGANFSNSLIKNLGKIEKIYGNAYFDNSQIQDLGNLKVIVGKASFSNSQIKDLGNLEKLGSVDFRNSSIKSLGKLTTIEGNVNFKDSQIEDLGNLAYIGGNAIFSRSKIKDLGKVKEIGYAIFSNSQIENLGNVETLGSAQFTDSKIKSLGTLKEIKNSVTFAYSDVIDLGCLTKIGGDADFEKAEITSLGNLKEIGGNAIFEDSNIEDLGDLTTIGGYADFENTQITSLKNLKTIKHSAYFNNSEIIDLGDLEFIGRDAEFKDSLIKDLGKLKHIGSDVEFKNTQIESLGNLTKIGGSADFSNSYVTDLGQLEYIGDCANFSHSQITDLKNIKRIDGGAYFDNSNVQNLGKLSYIGDDVFIAKSNLKPEDFKNVTINGEILNEVSRQFY